VVLEEMKEKLVFIDDDFGELSHNYKLFNQVVAAGVICFIHCNIKNLQLHKERKIAIYLSKDWESL
jgi:hypothetical protein